MAAKFLLLVRYSNLWLVTTVTISKVTWCVTILLGSDKFDLTKYIKLHNLNCFSTLSLKWTEMIESRDTRSPLVDSLTSFLASFV